MKTYKKKQILSTKRRNINSSINIIGHRNKKFLLFFSLNDLKPKIKYIVVVLLLLIAIPTVYFFKVSAAFEHLGQTTWSGTENDPLNERFESKTNIDTSTAGQITAGPEINEDWCDNAPTCDDSWLNRKLVTITNSGDAIETATNIEISVLYNSSMQSDFDDIRFTDMDGNNLGYYISEKTDNLSAGIILAIPNIPSGDSTIFMYFNNNNASSTSSISNINSVIEDSFETGEIQDSKWFSSDKDPSHFEFADDNNSLILHSPGYNYLYLINPDNGSTKFDRSITRVNEYSFKIDALNWHSCSTSYSGTYNLANITFNNTYANFNGVSKNNGICNDADEPIFFATHFQATNLGLNYSDDIRTPVFKYGEEYRIKVVVYEDGGASNWYKSASDNNWQPFYDTDTNHGSESTDVYYYFAVSNNTNDLSDITLSDVYLYGIENPEFNFGFTQFNSGANGSLVSNIFDVSTRPFFGKMSFDKSGLGSVDVQIRTDSDPTMTTATAWEECNYLTNDENIYNSTCVNLGQRYLQYRVILASTSSAEPSDILTFKSIDFEFLNDDVAPETGEIIGKKDATNLITEGGWSNAQSPNFSWPNAVDPDPGSGTVGYCLYFGTDDDPDLITTSGLLQGFDSQINTETCQFAIHGTSFDFKTLVGLEHNIKWQSYDDEPHNGRITGYTWSENINGNWVYHNVQGANNGDTLYFIVKPYDNVGNISQNGSQFSYKLDYYGPEGFSLVERESSLVKNTPAETITWMYNADAGLGWADEDSGLAGMKYCIVDVLSGGEFSPCEPDEHPENWVGPNLAAYGTADYMSDVWQQGDLRLTTNPDDPRYAASVLGEGNGAFFVFIGAMDNAGNINVSDGQNILQKYTTIPSGAPQNLTVDPAEPNSVNSFSFDWDAPEVTDNPFYSEDPSFFLQILEGSRENFSYCWSVNEPINEAGTNCTRTAKGVTELPVGPYATEQGVNTLYIMTINEAGNFMSTYTYTDEETQEEVTFSNMAEIEFTADTIAPGIPQNVEVIDVSTLLDPIETSIWRLALSWTEPTSGVTTVYSYRILRSNDGVNFTEIMSVPADSLSYIDLGLSQIEYSYKILACDNAGSCGVASSVVSAIPTGRFTSPALLSDGPAVDPISTQKATISWKTNRESDSKIFLSTNPGIDTEIGKYDGGDATQRTEHNVQLNNLQAGTKYYYVATWTDGDGNIGKTEELSFTTLPAPNIAEVDIKNISIDGSTVNLSIENSTKLNAYYGKTENFGGVFSINTSMAKSSYSISLSGLDDDSKYYLRLNGFDADGHEYKGNIYSFTTLPRPRISNLRFQPITDASSNTTKVTWNTNVPASSELSYGAVGAAQTEVIDSKMTVDHEVTISGLIDNTDYSLVARSRDAAGNLAVSDAQTFKTALDTRPPKVSNITVDTTIKGSGAEARGQVVVSWTTDELATSQVAYGQGAPGNYNNKTAEDSRLTLEHVVIISDLSTSSIYQLQPISKDKANNSANGTNQSAIIGRGSEDVFTIIFNSLRKIFGIGK